MSKAFTKEGSGDSEADLDESIVDSKDQSTSLPQGLKNYITPEIGRAHV